MADRRPRSRETPYAFDAFDLDEIVFDYHADVSRRQDGRWLARVTAPGVVVIAIADDPDTALMTANARL